MRREAIARELERALRQSLDRPALRIIELEGERPAADEAREPWIPIKYGPAAADDWFGVVPAVARFEPSAGAAVQQLRLIIKVNPPAALARTLIPWIIEQRKIALDRRYWEYRTASRNRSYRSARAAGLCVGGRCAGAPRRAAALLWQRGR